MCRLPCQFKRFCAEGQRRQAISSWLLAISTNRKPRKTPRPFSEAKGQEPKAKGCSYPFTLILENDNTARPDVGCPIEVAGRKVVKISMFFTGDGRSLLA